MSQTTIELLDEKNIGLLASDNTKNNGDHTNRHTNFHECKINNVTINFPVKPYSCQQVLMRKVITALNKRENCILESPTGTGKTLALLCSTIAWQQDERNRINQALESEMASTSEAAAAFAGALTSFAELTTLSTPEKLFAKPVHGERSIYDAEQSCSGSSNSSIKRKREASHSPPGSLEFPSTSTPQSSTVSQNEVIDLTQEDDVVQGLVTIHKKTKLDQISDLFDPNTNKQEGARSQKIEKQRLPTIYYGARTHKQLEQVIKEFQKTPYCGKVRMTILSSREHSCVRRFDSRQWSSKNDMCTSCIKKVEGSGSRDGVETNCKYYENRAGLTHRVLPSAFTLDEIVGEGKRRSACPYYAAKHMALTSEIVFCPYNYLVDPAIKSNMNINVSNDVVIIDEAHNIETVCRDAASFTAHQVQILAAFKELEASTYKFSDTNNFVFKLRKTLYKWTYWFENQEKLLENQIPKNGIKQFAWRDAKAFVETLDSHDIGREQYADYNMNVQSLLRVKNDDPRAFVGVSSATCTLLETLDTISSYLFKNNGEHMEDFVMILGVGENSSSMEDEDSRDRRGGSSEQLHLSVLCMNPGVVFAALRAARTVVLASGTLSPLDALAAELDARFPHHASLAHVVPPHQVWAGVVATGPAGEPLRLTYGQGRDALVQDAVGETLLRASHLTPHGVLCFLTSYRVLENLLTRWRRTGLWQRLGEQKHLFVEAKDASKHNEVMKGFYEKVETSKGALLFGVYRGKVAEGMDFRDRQARLVVAVGIPFPNRTLLEVEHKLKYNERRQRGGRDARPLASDEWYNAQAFRPLNQAIGRCIRHRGDWGAVLLLDARYGEARYACRLARWLRDKVLNQKPYTYDELQGRDNSLKEFMHKMLMLHEDEEHFMGLL